MKISEKKVKEKTFSKRQKLVLKIYKRYNKNNFHKMTSIPVCKIPLNIL